MPDIHRDRRGLINYHPQEPITANAVGIVRTQEPNAHRPHKPVERYKRRRPSAYFDKSIGNLKKCFDAAFRDIISRRYPTILTGKLAPAAVHQLGSQTHRLTEPPPGTNRPEPLCARIVYCLL